MRDDYPTRDELEAILTFEGTPAEFIEYINSIWWSQGFTVKNGRDRLFKKGVKRAYLSTWGWSGNEDIIEVLKQTWLWMLWWRKSERGGHYEFEIPLDKYNEKLQFAYGLPHSKVE